MPRPTPTDAYPTKTSDLQADTEDILQEVIPPDGAGLVLDKKAHLQFLVRNLVQGFPARYMSQDASQPWLMFWTIQAFSTLQIAIDPDSKQRCRSPSCARCCVLNAFVCQGDRYYHAVATPRRWVWWWARAGRTLAGYLCVCVLSRDRGAPWSGGGLGSDKQVRLMN